VGAGSAPVRDRECGGLAEGVGGPALGVLVDVVGDRAMGAIVSDNMFVIVSLPNFYAGGFAELVDVLGCGVFDLTNKLSKFDRILGNRVTRSFLNFEDEVDMVGHDDPTLDRDSRILKTECL
jgi:hypothetical protein